MTSAVISATMGDPWRQARLDRGWEPLDVVGRMKTTADRQGLRLPPAWLLIQWLFVWENHRAALPTFYEELLTQVFMGRLSGGRR